MRPPGEAPAPALATPAGTPTEIKSMEDVVLATQDVKLLPLFYGKEALSDPELAALEDISRITKVPTRDLAFWYATSFSLNLEGKKLESVPDSIGNLGRLTTLHLTSNRLSTLPDSIGNLPNLESLFVHRNNLTSLPDSIGKLANLQDLCAGFNLLHAIPAAIGDMAALETLELPSNKISTLPGSMCKLRHLQKLSLFENPLTSIPAPVKAWILEREKQGCQFSGIEFVQPAPPSPKIKVEREAAVAKVRCPYCKYLTSPTDSLCPHCGAIL